MDELSEHYFQTQPAPANLDADIKDLREFIARHVARGTRVVLVTVSCQAKFLSLMGN